MAYENVLFLFIKKLFHISEDFGYEEKEILEVEKRLAISLPKVLRDYYKKFGKHLQLNHAQDNLVLPEKLLLNNDKLIFYTENQYVIQWAIDKGDMTKTNPAVYRSYDTETWELDGVNIYDFLKIMVYKQGLFANSVFPLEANAPIGAKHIERIQKQYKEVSLAVDTDAYEIRIFQNSYEHIIVVFSDSWICVSSRNEKDFQELFELLEGIEWAFVSTQEEEENRTGCMVVHKNGSNEYNPPLGSLPLLFDELEGENDPYCYVSVVHESDWNLSFYANGVLLFSNTYEVETFYMLNVAKEKVLALWRDLAVGKMEVIQQEPWSEGDPIYDRDFKIEE